MGQTPFARTFCFVCIDPDPVTRKRNDDLLNILQVESVPTVYYKGSKLVGSEAFEWLQYEMENMSRPRTSVPVPGPARMQPTQPVQDGPLQQPGQQTFEQMFQGLNGDNMAMPDSNFANLDGDTTITRGAGIVTDTNLPSAETLLAQYQREYERSTPASMQDKRAIIQNGQ